MVTKDKAEQIPHRLLRIKDWSKNGRAEAWNKPAILIIISEHFKRQNRTNNILQY